MFRRCKTAAEVTVMLENMPKSIFDCYAGMLSNIPEEYIFEARNVFQWLAFAKRSLFLEEVAEAAVYNPDENDWLHSDFRVLHLYEIDDICSGLITINPTRELGTEREQVGFIHPTVKEFLLSSETRSPKAEKFSISEMDSQKLICRANFDCLLFSTQPNSSLDRRPVQCPLLQYATEYWFEHVNAVRSKGAIPAETVKLAIALFDTKRNESILKGIDTSLATDPEGPQAVNQEMNQDRGFPPPLYYASLLGIAELVPPLLARNESEFAGGCCGSPIQAAAYGGNPEIVREMIQWCSNINFESGKYGSALQAAIHSGHDSIVQMLLDSGTDPNAGSGLYGNPLQAAAVRGNADHVQTLIEYRADIDAKGGEYGTALIAAAQGSHTRVVKILLENGADVNQSDTRGKVNALYAAASSGHSEVVKLLLDRGADPNLEGGEYGSALEVAAGRGHTDIVEMLVRNGAHVHSKVSSGPRGTESALHLAVQGGHEGVLALLLRRSSLDANSKDKDGLSPLMKAASCGHDKIVQMLLDKGVDTKTRDTKGATALQIAADEGHEAVVQLLSELGPEMYDISRAGKTALEEVEQRLEQVSKASKRMSNPTMKLEIPKIVEPILQMQELEQSESFKATTHEEELEPLQHESPRRRRLSPRPLWSGDAGGDLEGSSGLLPPIFDRPALRAPPTPHDGHPEDNVAENAFHPLAGPASLGDDTRGESLQWWRRHID